MLKIQNVGEDFIKLFHNIGAENLKDLLPKLEGFIDGMNKPLCITRVLCVCTSTVKLNRLHKSSGRFLLVNSKIN